MTCNQISPLLHAYVDHELDLRSSLELEQHFQNCPHCAAMKQSLGSLHSTLRHADLAYPAPETLRERIFRRAQMPRKREPRSSTPWFWRWLALGATGFAVVTFLLSPAAISPRQQLAEEAISSHIRSLMPGHLTDVASSDQHTVKPWFNGKIDFAPNVKDFAAQGFPLIGGRLDYLNHQTVAALVYRRNQHTINVFVWPVKNGTGENTETRRGYTVINRSVNGLRYCIVSDLNEKDLSDFAKFLGG